MSQQDESAVVVTEQVCPFCLQHYPCAARCTLELVDPKKAVLSKDGSFALVYPEAFVIYQRGLTPKTP